MKRMRHMKETKRLFKKESGSGKARTCLWKRTFGREERMKGKKLNEYIQRNKLGQRQYFTRLLRSTTFNSDIALLRFSQPYISFALQHQKKKP